jgi:hypothetical protein
MALGFQGSMKHSIIILLLLITGCTSNSNQEYPDDWAKIPKVMGNECPDISGKYENIATNNKGESGLNLACELTNLRTYELKKTPIFKK